MATPKSEDYIPKDLALQIADVIAKGVSMGSKQGFSGANFMQDMTSQMEDFVKSQKGREINEKVYALTLAKGISTRQAEVQILAQISKQENANSIQTLQGKLKNKNLSFDERKELEGQLDILRQMPGILDSMVAARLKQLQIEEEQAKLEEDQTMVKEKFEEINKTLKARIGITDELIDQLRTPEMAKALFLDATIKKLDQAMKSFEGFREIGLSAGDAVNAQFKGMSFESMLGLSDTKGVLQGVVEEFGNVNALSSDTVNDLGKMAHHLGISGQEAMKLNASLSQMGGETSESATAAMEHTAHLAEAQGIAGSKVFGDMAKNTGAMALYSKGGAEGFGKAAIELHKMGVEIATAAKMADGLLDFESSINKQMEASVLLGREINLDKARELALSGDLEGSTAEVLKNIGGSAEFDKMNVMQKKALAEATGMSVEELQKSIDAQEESNKYIGEGASLADKALGGIIEYGSAATGFLKENAELILSGTQFLLDGNLKKAAGYAMDAAHWIKQKAQWVAEKAHGLWLKTQGAAAGGVAAAKGALGAGGAAAKGVGAATEAAGKMGDAAGAASKVPAGAGKSTGGLTKAIEKINPGKLLAGAAALVLVAAAVYVFAKAAQEFGNVKLPDVLMAVAAMFALVGALALVGTIISSPLVGQAILLGAVAMLVMAAAVFVLGKAIQEMAKGFDMFAPALLQLAPMAADIVVLGAGMTLLGAGMLVLGYASLIAFPGLMLAAFGLNLMLPAAMALGALAQSGGLSSLGEAFMIIAAASPGLIGVAVAMAGIGAGLGLMAMAGLGALPIIGALMGLAAVAPMLASLGSMFGGGGDEGGAKEDKMDKVVEKLDQLIAVASRGGEIKMDGKKVGEVVRLGLNMSNVR